MSAHETPNATTPKVLFVDDEQRVLNSMRIMFRRRFDLFLATDGATALDIVKNNPIDVIVADHRMPQMSGVEVLATVRSLSPQTVRILLTGYADLDAIEGSINEGEVFRFLTKPCAPMQLREAIDLAVRAARSGGHAVDPQEQLAHELLASSESATPADPPPDAVEDFTRTRTEQELAKTDVIEPRLTATISAIEEHRPRVAATGIEDANGVIVFSSDADVVRCVTEAAQDRFPVHVASNIVQVVKTLTEHRAGVLVTDVTQDRNTIQTMTAALKRHLPELVTVVISEHRDALDMVWLINHGQIFRFLRKPVSPGRCAVSLQAALRHHCSLRKNPRLNERYVVDRSEEPSVLGGMFEKLKTVRRLWA